MTVADKEREGRFDALFRQYLPDMVAYCGWRSGSRADAQDAVAEVFLAAWRRLEEIPDGKEARLWLYGTARRVVANQARADRRRTRLSARIAEACDGYDAEADEMGAALPADAARATAPLTAVHAALAQLRPADREVLLLAEWEGLAPAQIAALMGCPTVTARGRLFRARRRFRHTYEALLASPEGAAALPGAQSAPEQTASNPPVQASRSTQGVIRCS